MDKKFDENLFIIVIHKGTTIIYNRSTNIWSVVKLRAVAMYVTHFLKRKLFLSPRK